MHIPDSDSFTFEDILGPKDTLEMAIVAAFVLDFKWVLQHFAPPSDFDLLLVTKHSDEKDRAEGRLEVLSDAGRARTYRLVPTVHGKGAMHTKLILVSFRLC